MDETHAPTILIVEDDPIARMHTQRAFEAATGRPVLVCSTGEEAVQRAQETRISVAVLDIGLPGIDGIETARRIRKRQDTSIVFVTGNNEASTVERARSADPYSILTKPVDVEHVIETVRQIVGARHPPNMASVQPGFLLDTLYDTAQVGMCVTDEHRRFVRVNRSYRDTYGYLTSELIGHEFTAVLPPEDREHAARMHDEFIAGDLAELPADWRVQRKDGEIRHVYVTAGLMVATDGHRYKVTTVSDITERQNSQLQLQSALRHKEMLLSELNHRVKNNLNTLGSLVELERGKPSLTQDARDALKNVSDRIRAMGTVYERLQGTETTDSVDVRDLIQTILDGLGQDSSAAANSIQANVEPITATIDVGVAIGLVVNELVTNSLKHATVDDRMLEIKLTLTHSDDYITIEISDNGPGFPPGFDAAQSTGLGVQLLTAISAGRRGTVEIADPLSAHIKVTLAD